MSKKAITSKHKRNPISDFLIPTIIDKVGGQERAYDIYSRLLEDRVIFLGDAIDSMVANTVTVSYTHLFLYTVGDLTNETDTALLSRMLLSTLESDDIEMLRIIDLHLESDHTDANPELIERAFRDLLR